MFELSAGLWSGYSTKNPSLESAAEGFVTPPQVRMVRVGDRYVPSREAGGIEAVLARHRSPSRRAIVVAQSRESG